MMDYKCLKNRDTLLQMVEGLSNFSKKKEMLYNDAELQSFIEDAQKTWTCYPKLTVMRTAGKKDSVNILPEDIRQGVSYKPISEDQGEVIDQGYAVFCEALNDIEGIEVLEFDERLKRVKIFVKGFQNRGVEWDADKEGVAVFIRLFVEKRHHPVKGSDLLRFIYKHASKYDDYFDALYDIGGKAGVDVESSFLYRDIDAGFRAAGIDLNVDLQRNFEKIPEKDIQHVIELLEKDEKMQEENHMKGRRDRGRRSRY